ncbi:MAG: DUF6174 domain-containing protein [Bacteroidota bacterium]|jgi:hypothetical protein
MRLPIVPIIALIGTLAACSDHGSEPLPADPYRRWLSYKIHDYTIDQVRECFCIDGGATMRVTVRGDTVAQVVRLSDSSLVSPKTASWYLPIDSLFGIIRNPSADSIVVEYDEHYGYPRVLDINPQQHPVDGGVLYRIVNFQVP